MRIEELKHGSPKAFRAMVERYSQGVIQTCFHFVNNAEDAEDLAQEVFIEIYQSVRHFRNESDFGTWVYRICINTSLDYLRKQKRKKRIADLKGLFLARHQPSVAPGQRLERQERRDILYKHIALLAENQRTALVLSQFDRLNNSQIAEIMGTTESAVESLLHRARANLRKHLEKYFTKNV